MLARDKLVVSSQQARGELAVSFAVSLQWACGKLATSSLQACGELVASLSQAWTFFARETKFLIVDWMKP